MGVCGIHMGTFNLEHVQVIWGSIDTGFSKWGCSSKMACHGVKTDENLGVGVVIGRHMEYFWP